MRRHLLAAAATVVGVAGMMRLLYDPLLNYDARYALLWARDLMEGQTPEYLADFAPTPHPLQTGASVLALAFGDQADQVAIWTALLCFGALVYLVYRLGAELFSPWVGVVAAVAVATRPALHRDAVLAYQDVAFAALIVGAVLLEAQKRRRGLPVLATLAVAGLMRPEAWVLSGLYVLYLWRYLEPGRRIAVLLVAGLAPAVWAGTDWLVTDDLLHSLHGTADLAEAVDRRREVSDVPYWTAQYFGFVLREPLLIGIPIGLAFAWVHRSRFPRSALPVVVAVAMVLVFAIGPIFGLPLIGRYVRTPAALLTIFYGVAVAGWLLLAPGSARTRWAFAGGVALLASLAFLPWHVDMLRSLHGRTERANAFYAELEAVADSPQVREAFQKCGPLSTADHRPIPFIRYWLDGDPGSVGTVAGRASPLGDVFLAPRDTPANRRRFEENFPRAKAPADYQQIYTNRTWRVDAAPSCVRRLRA